MAINQRSKFEYQWLKDSSVPYHSSINQVHIHDMVNNNSRRPYSHRRAKFPVFNGWHMALCNLHEQKSHFLLADGLWMALSTVWAGHWRLNRHEDFEVANGRPPGSFAIVNSSKGSFLSSHLGVHNFLLYLGAIKESLAQRLTISQVPPSLGSVLTRHMFLQGTLVQWCGKYFLRFYIHMVLKAGPLVDALASSVKHLS